jgi:hypothetical protein
MNRLNVKALAIALGASWAFCILFAGWVAIFGWSVQFVEVMGSVYLGYNASFTGAIIGALWGFVDGAIAGVVIAFIYNVVSKDK